jgi:hypothetical protein
MHDERSSTLLFAGRYDGGCAVDVQASHLAENVYSNAKVVLLRLLVRGDGPRLDERVRLYFMRDFGTVCTMCTVGLMRLEDYESAHASKPSSSEMGMQCPHESLHVHKSF